MSMQEKFDERFGMLPKYQKRLENMKIGEVRRFNAGNLNLMVRRDADNAFSWDRELGYHGVPKAFESKGTLKSLNAEISHWIIWTRPRGVKLSGEQLKYTSSTNLGHIAVSITAIPFDGICLHKHRFASGDRVMKTSRNEYLCPICTSFISKR